MRQLAAILALAIVLPAMAQENRQITIESFHIMGPSELRTPFSVDSVDTGGRKYDEKQLLDTPAETSELFKKEATSGIVTSAYGHSLAVAGFRLSNRSYSEAEISVKLPAESRTEVDGRPCTGKLSLRPGTHDVIIRWLMGKDETDTLRVSLSVSKGDLLQSEGKRMYTIEDVLHATRLGRLSLSPDGRFLLAGYTRTLKGGKTERGQRLYDLKSSSFQETASHVLGWTRDGHTFYSMDNGALMRTDAASGEKTLLARIPDGMFTSDVSEDERTIILTGEDEGARPDSEVHEIVSPDDRQPGWRDRSYIAIMNVATGVTERLTFGYSSTMPLSLSKDGSKLLFMSSRNRYGKRPTTVSSLYLMDIATRECLTIVKDDGFISRAILSPDASKVLISGSPECLGRIGDMTGKGQTPSMVDNQLYMYDIATGKTVPLTRKFDPSVTDFEWSSKDNMVYLTAENRDEVSLYRLDPANGKITQIKVPEEMVNSFALSSQAPLMAYASNSASNSDRLYVLDTSDDESRLLWDVNAKALEDVELGKCEAWTFKNSRGDMITGRFYLPADFDPSRKYPMIVNYYGGCSPTSRTFESRYPHHAYAALGYVVYVIEPSGATGFGQEFSARHVNTAGEGPAQDIIEGVERFCKEHAFVDKDRIGCIGASYGGFMTQYLQTKTDIFAAAISHAGISDHTSYWGEGYWGFSYSEVSMANEYPWTNHELYVNRSPLFQADRIHTPLLFLHGTADHNVPLGESIQMYNALRLLGRETAFVEVEGQDHHILDYSKRIKWQMTIFAWFEKYLKGDPSWWDTMYPHFVN